MRALRVLLLTLLGCGRSLGALPAPAAGPRGAAAAPVRLGGPPRFVAGEQMAFTMTWFTLPIARLRLAVGRPGALWGRPAVVVRADVRSDGVVAVVKRIRDVMTTAVDLERGVPVGNAGTFDALYTSASFERDLGAELELGRWTRAGPAGEPVLDTLAAAGALRAWTAAPGARAFFDGWIGSGRHRVDLVMGPREELDAALGPRWPARRIEGAVRTRGRDYRFTLWFSDDAERLPLRLVSETDFGAKVTVELTGYARP